ncbi:hypothetical protein [Brevibacillus reuszeri]|uniref:hypothetical protein n=1 Tax=Brevibacillus reuszeri TaxID=54915 RepID=UPI000CCC4A20|nr:hypothetical protein [Brevibacillus reuszeri]
MKKILSVSLLTASLLAGGTGIIHAEEQPAQEQKLNQTPEYQELQSLLTIKKDLNEKLKAQTSQNKAMWESVRSGVSEEVRAAVKNVMQEIKPIRETNKALTVQLKEAKAAKDKAKVAELKAAIEANHQAIKSKLTPIESELAQVKALHQQLKEPMAQIKPIREAKKANREDATQIKQQFKDKMKVTKEAYKHGDNTWSTSLTEAIDLLEQWTDIENEILSQKASIYDALQ